MGDSGKNRNGDGGSGTTESNRTRPAFEIKVDRAKRELHVSATRAVAGVSLAGFCGLLIGIVALSRNATNNGPQQAHAYVPPQPISIINPGDEPPKFPPSPVTPTKASPVKSTTTSAAATPLKTVVAPTTQPARQRTTSVAATPKPEAVKDGHVVGFTYLVFGSYRTPEEVQAAQKQLKKKGVACSVEETLPGFTKKGWYSLVDVKGYKSTQDKAYKKQVTALAEKHLEPQPYRWRAATAAATASVGDDEAGESDGDSAADANDNDQ
jgi:hypothetical protein